MIVALARARIEQSSEWPLPRSTSNASDPNARTHAPPPSFAAWYAHIPGLKVVSCYASEDSKGLLKAAIRDPDPVVVLESEILYNKAFPMREAALRDDWLTPIGVAAVEREGHHVTVVTHGRGVDFSLEAADALAADGVSVEVLNLRTIRPLDIDAIMTSVAKTHRLVTVEEGFRQHGVGAEIVALVAERGIELLDAPVERVTCADVPMPYADNLERASMAGADNVVAAVRRVVEGGI